MNLPNILTVLRMIMVPLFVGAFLSERVTDWIALAIFALAALTDALDGHIARKQNIVTDFGKLMDPLADKVMVMAAFVCFSAAGLIHPMITIVVLAREFYVTGLRSVAVSKGKVIAADFLGKAKTISQYAVVIATFVNNTSGAGRESFSGTFLLFATAVMLALAIFSAVNYSLKNKEFFKG